MAGYTYDSTGQSYFFALTILLCFLLPFTYSTLRGGSERSAARVPYPCVGWNQKSDEVKKSKAGGAKGLLSFRYILLALGWVAFAVVVQKASTIEGESVAFDPFKILGVSTSATEKEIKKHYRKMSLKFHPDKLVLAVNQTKEEADNIFVELTKAYKSLTDEVSRHNFEMFGHPDGKQEFSQGIALPSWVIESHNIWWVMGAYALVLGVMLPFLVGRWWYSTRALTKDGVLNTTAATFFLSLKEETTFPLLLDILAAADEFATDPKLLKLRKKLGKPAVDEYARITSLVRESPDGKEGWEGYAGWQTPQKRARVLIAAHMLRIPIKDSVLLEEKLATVTIALPLCAGLTSIALSHNWLSSLISILHLQQFLLQAVHSSSSPLLQLPHVTDDIVKAARAIGVENITQFGKLEAGQVEKLLVGWPEKKKRDVFEVAKNWPVTSVIDAKFKVVGEKIVTPGAIVSFTIKLRLTPPGQVGPAPEVTKVTVGEQENEGEESSIEELIGRRKAGEDGEEPTPFAHAPQFPKNRKPTWSIFIGDHKLNRVFVAPQKFTDMGSKQVRTIRMSFQAPPGPGLYTFQVYAMSDAFVGTDAQKDMRMQVEPPSNGEELVGEEDDISEPDEDTIAGQMALMKGQSVRRAPREDDEEDSEEEYTSGTEESESESETSDSDSD
ncbi:Sec63 Brl domain-domain-containing protein [Leucosporidium creatinivorum]|uniref:Sec63 Brl domain-domain-containing protein n=1 Tax=Leucosporidium creatinivorum TaxID=106004 RepID=A0A1Y2D274_9BASI|nr:Sec63 Brl domain-domain-containing protein [Leucosporidium creatinivorum]